MTSSSDPTLQLRQSPYTTKLLAEFARFKAEHDAKRKPYVSQSVEEYEARPWAKPESSRRPY